MEGKVRWYFTLIKFLLIILTSLAATLTLIGILMIDSIYEPHWGQESDNELQFRAVKVAILIILTILEVNFVIGIYGAVAKHVGSLYMCGTICALIVILDVIGKGSSDNHSGIFGAVLFLSISGFSFAFGSMITDQRNHNQRTRISYILVNPGNNSVHTQTTAFNSVVTIEEDQSPPPDYYEAIRSGPPQNLNI